MAPGGGILCSMFVPAILCDLVVGRFFRSGIFCMIAAFLSLTGMMHGANYHQHNGRMIPTIGADESDYYTTDLGEFMLSLPVTAKMESWQTDEQKELGVGNVPSYSWSYKIDEQGFDDPYRCPPWYNSWLGADDKSKVVYNSKGLPCPEPKMQPHAYNEGWRFALAYFFGGLLIFGHGGLAMA